MVELVDHQPDSKVTVPHTKIKQAYSKVSDGNMSFKYARTSLGEVRANRICFLTNSGFDPKKIVLMEAVNGSQAAKIESKNTGGIYEVEKMIRGTDALVSQDPTLALASVVADCPTVAFWSKNTDPEKYFLALAHAGRAGIEAGILENTLKLINQLECGNRDNLSVSISPGVHGCCYILNYLETNRWEFWSNHLKTVPWGGGIQFRAKRIEGVNGYKLAVDLIGVTHQHLRRLGILSENIQTSPSCTGCEARQGRLFSHTISREFNMPEARALSVVGMI